jgi:hypothetical protein
MNFRVKLFKLNMDNIFLKFYNGGRYDDINPGSEKRIYENFFSTNPETINNRKSYNKSIDYREKPSNTTKIFSTKFQSSINNLTQSMITQQGTTLPMII